MRPGWKLLGWLAVALLVALAGSDRLHEGSDHDGEHGHAGGHGEATTRGPLGRLAGPFASLAASVQWLRVERDLSAGRFARGYARAETALALDPRAAAGWSFLAHHLAFQRARPEIEADPDARRAFVRGALELLGRGERRSADPARLAFEAGLVLLHAAAYDEVEDWPGGAAGALREAAEHFERAAALGHPLGAEIAALARARAGSGADPARSTRDG